MEMDNAQKKRPLGFLLLILFISIVIGAVFLFYKNYPDGLKWLLQKPPVEEQKPKPLQITTSQVPQDKLPENFPIDIPLEKGATIVQNYNANASDGRVQATRSFVTSKSLDANYKLYKDFLTKNGWEILFSSNEKSLKVLSATKENLHIQITINENSVDKIKTVDISVTRMK